MQYDYILTSWNSLLDSKDSGISIEPYCPVYRGSSVGPIMDPEVEINQSSANLLNSDPIFTIIKLRKMGKKSQNSFPSRILGIKWDNHVSVLRL